MLQDARYLHEKLSALRDIGVPSGMLETVVKEKRVPRSSPFARKASRTSSVASNAVVPALTSHPRDGSPLPIGVSAESNGFREFRDVTEVDPELSAQPMPGQSGLSTDGHGEKEDDNSVGGPEG